MSGTHSGSTKLQKSLAAAFIQLCLPQHMQLFSCRFRLAPLHSCCYPGHLTVRASPKCWHVHCNCAALSPIPSYRFFFSSGTEHCHIVWSLNFSPRSILYNPRYSEAISSSHYGWVPDLPAAETNTKSNVTLFPWVTSQQLSGRLTTLYHFHCGKGNVLYLLKYNVFWFSICLPAYKTSAKTKPTEL